MFESDYHCPSCQAPFQGKKICPECHADLEPLMKSIARSFYLRCQARKALGEGHFQTSRRFAQQAQRLHRTFRGQSLLNVATIAQAIRFDQGT